MNLRTCPRCRRRVPVCYDGRALTHSGVGRKVCPGSHRKAPLSAAEAAEVCGVAAPIMDAAEFARAFSGAGQCPAEVGR